MATAPTCRIVDGYERWTLPDGRLHRLDGPALRCAAGHAPASCAAGHAPASWYLLGHRVTADVVRAVNGNSMSSGLDVDLVAHIAVSLRGPAPDGMPWHQHLYDTACAVANVAEATGVDPQRVATLALSMTTADYDQLEDTLLTVLT